MRHRRNFNHLSRTSTHRKAMLANMAASLILHKKINTTLAKAKALRSYVEPLITRSKEDTTHSRRIVFAYLQNKEAVTELFREVSQKVADRPGGYTRILKTGTRLGDNAEMALIELVDYNENLLGTKATDKKEKAGTRRRRGVGRKKETVAGAAPLPVAAEEPPAEDGVEEVIDQVEEPINESESAENAEPAEGADSSEDVAEEEK